MKLLLSARNEAYDEKHNTNCNDSYQNHTNNNCSPGELK